jgi:hypothetical protein
MSGMADYEGSSELSKALARSMKFTLDKITAHNRNSKKMEA